MESSAFINYLHKGCFVALMQGQGVNFELGKPGSPKFVDFLTIKKASSFAFISFLDRDKIVPITTPEEDKAFLDASYEDEIKLMNAIQNKDWVYYHSIFDPESNMAVMGGLLILNVSQQEISQFLKHHQINWYVHGEINAVAELTFI